MENLYEQGEYLKDCSLNFPSETYKGKIFNLVQDFKLTEEQQQVFSNMRTRDAPKECIVPSCNKLAKLYNLCSEHNKNILDKPLILFRKAGLFLHQNKKEAIEMIMERNDNKFEN